ncbi:hypothetical protein BVRB_7g157200 [Beta vulgaris subsp. vulgaris]|nr:hypothetical protein BVRB_7g157200 [Beta vulgaris subsp. vulgaris]
MIRSCEFLLSVIPSGTCFLHLLLSVALFPPKLGVLLSVACRICSSSILPCVQI